MFENFKKERHAHGPESVDNEMVKLDKNLASLNKEAESLNLDITQLVLSSIALPISAVYAYVAYKNGGIEAATIPASLTVASLTSFVDAINTIRNKTRGITNEDEE